jgi:hypothetical protein
MGRRIRKCIICGKVFESGRRKGRMSKAITCSTECSSKYSQIVRHLNHMRENKNGKKTKRDK